MKTEDAVIFVRELTDYLAHDRTGMIVSGICQNKGTSLEGLSDESKISLLEFAVILKELKTQL